jgi:hypothetical protein
MILPLSTVCVSIDISLNDLPLRHTYEVARWGLTPDLREPWGGIRYYHCRPSIYQLVP